ncbi:MAG: Do family serine endopeptidase [Rhodothermales bacterium]
MSSRNRTPLLFLIALAFVAGAFFTTAGANWLNLGDAVGTRSDASVLPDDRKPLQPSTAVVSLEDAFTNVADRVNPSVVQIRAEVVREAPQMSQQNPFFEFFQQRPGQGQDNPREFRSSGLGSGVVVRPDGYIVTNNHVIDGAAELEVRMNDGTFYDAEVIGTDPGSDLAVIKVDVDDLPYVSFGEFDDVRVGQWVMAFGSPFSADLGNTATAGIVSAIGRTGQEINSLNVFSAFIQTDASINPGNSGGPLVNLRGEIIGINSAILSRSGGSQGIGFAIPVDVVENVATQLIDNGAVARGYLGVQFGAVSESLARALDVPRGAAGIEVVTPESPADRAGLRDGDIIVAIDGVTLQDSNQLRTTIANLAPGDRVNLEVERDGRRMDLAVTLGDRTELDGEAASVTPRPSSESDSMEALGLGLRNLTENDLRSLNVGEDVEGVLVAQIEQSSVAYREGNLRRGDIIVEADRQGVTSMREFKAVFDDLEAGETFIVKVRRMRGETLTSFLTALTKPE